MMVTITIFIGINMMVTITIFIGINMMVVMIRMDVMRKSKVKQTQPEETY